MHSMKITLIAAIGKNREIGQANQLLWDLPTDMQHFRQRTAGKPVIMGRKTFDSIGHPLPGRDNIVLTRNPEWQHEGARHFFRFDQMLQTLRDENHDEVMIIGGEHLYHLALPIATHLSLTLVNEDFPAADAFFPEVEWSQWSQISQEKHPADDTHAHQFAICEYAKI
jgi:dihydrofolate reductase